MSSVWKFKKKKKAYRDCFTEIKGKGKGKNRGGNCRGLNTVLNERYWVNVMHHMNAVEVLVALQGSLSATTYAPRPPSFTCLWKWVPESMTNNCNASSMDKYALLSFPHFKPSLSLPIRIKIYSSLSLYSTQPEILSTEKQQSILGTLFKCAH